MKWQFGEVTVDSDARLVTDRNGPVRVERLVFRLIVLLLENHDRVVSKDEIIQDLWDGRVVGDSSITRAVSLARRALRSRETPEPIKSVYGTGYRLQATPRRLGAGLLASERQYPFVGRTKELERISRAISLLPTDGGTLILVTGEPGIGKTSLLRECLRAAAARGCQVRLGRCWESGGAPPYWPWTQVLRQEAQERGPAEEHEFDAIGPFLSTEATSEPSKSNELNSGARRFGSRFALFESIGAFLAKRSRLGPTVIGLDDLHSADLESIALLSTLSHEIRSSPILIIGTYRHAEAKNRGLLRQLASSCTTAQGWTGHLQGLSGPEIAQMSAAEGADDRLIAELAHRSGGNPLFIKHMLAALDFGERIEQVPAALADIISNQIELLPRDVTRALQVSSVLGPAFDRAAATQLLQNEGEVGKMISVACQIGILQPDDCDQPGIRYRFTHVVVRDFLYQHLAPVDRARAHAQAASALDGQNGPDIAAIAYHWRMAAPVAGLDSAIDASIRAARAALRRHAYEEAALHHRAAEEMLLSESTEDTRRAQNLIGLAEALGRAGDKEEAWRACEAAARLGRRLRNPSLVAAAALATTPGILSIETSLFDPRHVLLLKDAISMGGQDDETLVRLLSRLATSLYWSDHIGDRGRAVERALHLANRTGTTQARTQALYAYHAHLWVPGTTEERLTIARNLVRSCGDDLEDRTLFRSVLITDLAEMGLTEELRSEIGCFQRDAEEFREPASVWLSPMFQGMLHLVTGNFVDVPGLCQQLQALGDRVGSEDAANCLAAQTALYRFEKGDGDAVIDSLLDHAVKHPNVMTLFRTAPAWAAAELGRKDEARDFLGGFSRTDFADVPWDMNWLGSMVVLAMAASEAGDDYICDQLYRRLAPYERQFAILGYCAVGFGSVASHLGRLAARTGNQEAAERLFRYGILANARAGARPWLARTLYGYGVAAKGWGALEQGEALIGEGLALSRALGMDHMFGRCLAASSK